MKPKEFIYIIVLPITLFHDLMAFYITHALLNLKKKMKIISQPPLQCKMYELSISNFVHSGHNCA